MRRNVVHCPGNSNKTSHPKGPSPPFHVKQTVDSVLFSFADTKIFEDHIQHIIDVNPSGNPPEGTGRQAEVLGRQFRCSGAGIESKKPAEGGTAFFQGFTMPGPGQGGGRRGRRIHQRRDTLGNRFQQALNAVAGQRRDRQRRLFIDCQWRRQRGKVALVNDDDGVVIDQPDRRRIGLRPGFATQLPAPQGQTYAVVADDPSLAGGLEFSNGSLQTIAGMTTAGGTFTGAITGTDATFTGTTTTYLDINEIGRAHV